MMPAPRRLLILLILLVCSASVCQSAELQTPDLLVYGSSDKLFLARRQQTPQPDPTSFTRVETRTLPSGQWRQITELAGRAIALGGRGGEFVLLMESGDWWYGKGLGVPLPWQRRIQLLAGHNDQLWAVGAPRSLDPTAAATRPGVPAASTHPTTAPAAAPIDLSHHDHASLDPQPTSTILFRLDKNTWKPVTFLPPELADGLGAQNTILSLVDDGVLIARLLGDNSVRLYRWSAQTHWSEPVTIKPPFQVYAMHALDVSGQPALWVASRSGPGALYFGREQWAALHALKIDADLSNVTTRAIAVAAERIRLFYLDNDKLFEQQFDEDGQTHGAVSQVALPRATDQKMLNFIQLALMFALMFLLMGSVRRRPVPDNLLESAHLRIAPMGRRLAAGLIDALPYLIGLYLYADRVDDTAAHLTEPVAYPAWIGVGIYFLHISLLEMFRGQSIGKMIFGLRVVGIDGKKAPIWSILVRNLILIIEVFLLFPLILVFYSPLRQRIGDMTARTLVVRADEPLVSKDPTSPGKDQPPPR